MGNNTAENLDENIEEEVVIDLPEEEQDNSGDDSEGEENQDAIEFEIVRQGEEGSQPDNKQRGFQKRVNKLNSKIAVANDAATQASRELETEREKNKLLRLALEQKAPVENVSPPDPMDFDDGVKDAEYIKALNNYNMPIIAAEVQKQTASLRDTSSRSKELEKKQLKHFERAEELGAKDYDETEDTAISILGKDTVNELIVNSDKSHLVLYYLGKNPSKAEELAELIKTNPLKATLQFGRLEAELNVKPKAKQATPNPDEELEGGSPSAGGQNNIYQKKLDKARKAAESGGSMGDVLKAKREAKAAGVSVL